MATAAHQITCGAPLCTTQEASPAPCAARVLKTMSQGSADQATSWQCGWLFSITVITCMKLFVSIRKSSH